MLSAAAILRQARYGAGLDQRELAARSGVPQSTVARIETGRTVPRLDTLDRLLRACDVTLAPVERPGSGVDRTLIRARLRLTPGERARLAVREWQRTAFLRR